MRLAFVTAAVGAVIIAACGRGSTPSSPSSTTATTTTTSSVTGCVVTASTPGTPLTSGPIFHNVAVAQTTNGLALTGVTEALSHASVADAVVLPDGTTGVYYVNGETDGIWLARLSGTTLTPVSAIKIDGFVRPLWAVDPDVTLVDGKVRLTYLFGLGSGTAHRICVAESSDGITFTTRSLAMSFTGQNETDPSVVQLPDKSWLMAVASNRTVLLARSSDGLTYTESSRESFGDIAELALTSDNRVRLYVCASGGIDAYTSSNSGSSWTREGTVTGTAIPGRSRICHPSALPSRNLFMFKTE